MQVDVCAGRRGLCSAMRPIDGENLLQYLLKVKFRSLSGDPFHFKDNGDGPARYRILNFQRNTDGQTFSWRSVGSYRSESGLQV